MARSVEHSHISGRNVRPFVGFNPEDYQSLSKLGINLSARDVRKMISTMDSWASDNDIDLATMDGLQALQTTASILSPVQFLQTWLPGWVNVITTARKIDQLVGISTVGNWEDEAIVQGFMEQTGGSVPYTDFGNIPLSSWNLNFTERNVVRFEEGMHVGVLEEARASRVRVNSSDEKRGAATVALEIRRNAVGFLGFNAGLNLTYGFLNDPGLGTFTIFANGATSGTSFWSGKTFMDITADLRTVMAALRQQSGDNIDPSTQAITIALATNVIDYLSVVTDLGSVSVMGWLKQTYPNVRIVSAPELEAAHAGDNVLYAWAENVTDGSTDDGRTFIQMVPSKFKLVGVEQKAKSYVEDYSNATAGILCKRPYAVVRFYGN